MTIEELLKRTEELDKASRLDVTLFIHSAKEGTVYEVMFTDWHTSCKNTYEVAKVLDEIEPIVKRDWI